MLNRLSTCVVALTSLVLGVATFGACVDPEKRFDEFHDRVPIIDASTVDRPVVPVSDINGSFYLAIKAINFNNTLHLGATFTLNTGTNVLSATFKPLSAPPGVDPPPRVPVGALLNAMNIQVDDTASFSAPVVGTIDGMANPISGSPLGSQVTLVGTIKSVDLVCGTVTGSVCLGMDAPCPQAPVSVEPATFAAVRVQDATFNTLPPLPATDQCPP